MLTQAAISITNVQRWSQERGVEVALARSQSAGEEGTFTSAVPEQVRERAKRTQYEVSVVDAFISLGSQSFAFHGTEAVWERPLPTGDRGRPPSIDVSLFNASRNEESRIEFGQYSSSKLKSDATKLADLKSRSDGHTITNYLILWDVVDKKHTRSDADAWRKRVEKDAEDTAEKSCVDIRLRVASTQDLFVAAPGRSRFVRVACFSVGNEANETGGDV
jgi:hypothetical protein